MTTAIVLINAERQKISKVGDQLAAIHGVTEVFSVSGRYDLVALIRLKNHDDLAELMTGKITEIEGITRTESMVAFRVLSKHDLEGMFDLGS
ncbi:MAG: Lrp/AsnC ligand binding domain-containing protein [Cytophagaceae bacterium]|jgi:DNA-binding Lrp family transcriptional regulator|nr:Lrp/AsnC ligand binding domain-containing protein [Cytophagaceae bacterium]MBK9932572.1 Lrp/AsnC ligand binding domain-containing protein [Cytophagaceae bacterium]MBL0303743.1 Lrp/AsnC ligand binding domain-containing protein [Cytophagaceae bacterium]MBL0326567.1 Lrp/AsnC ligand binding domain-containing protein [Cytophagaceae bacterium]MCA0363056.1 Lrp/AsnC ligand binding domain-containing protein [Bacteroidota bacterium]